MPDPTNGNQNEIDAGTSRAITRGIGERLRTALKTDADQHPALLQRLLDELARQERNQAEARNRR